MYAKSLILSFLGLLIVLPIAQAEDLPYYVVETPGKSVWIEERPAAQILGEFLPLSRPYADSVNFAVNSVMLTDEAKLALDKYIQALPADYADYRGISISGYADAFENQAARTSFARASEVAKYFLEKGVPVQLLMVQGMGISNSMNAFCNNLAESDRNDCLGPDRRVEIEARSSR